MKLKEWAEKTGIKYLTAYRWFKAGDIPGAYQTGSGTILVPDELTAEKANNDAMSLFLKKTVEFSKNNSTVEDFAAFILSNFQLKLNSQADTPKYSKSKPKSEEIQKHFQQFLPDKEKEEYLKAVKNSIKEQNKGDPRYEAPVPASMNLSEPILGEPNPFSRVVEASEMDAEYEDIGEFLSSMAPQFTAEGLVTRSVDLNTTPQQVNYTGSTNQTFSSSTSSLVANTVSGDISGAFTVPTVASIFADGALLGASPVGVYMNSQPSAAATPFLPTQKELLSSVQVIETAESEGAPRKRGRKPTLIKKR